jgi:hypothetical protein
MGRFLVDEDMPRSTSVVLREAGHEVEDVRDAGLKGEDLRGLLIIVEPHRIRIRRPASDPW